MEYEVGESRRDGLEVKDKRKSYFVQIDNDVFLVYAKLLGPYAVMVYGALAAYAGKREVAWPSLKKLAESLGITVPTVDKAIDTLISYNMISKEGRTNSQGRASNVYSIRDRSEWRFVNEINEPERLLNSVNEPTPKLFNDVKEPRTSELLNEINTNNIHSNNKIHKDKEQDSYVVSKVANENDNQDGWIGILRFYRDNINRGKSVTPAQETMLWGLYTAFTPKVLLQALVESVLNNRKDSRPTTNFIRAICVRIAQQEETNKQRELAIRNPGEVASPVYEQDEWLVQQRKSLLEGLGDGDQRRD
jgi:predicted transcriptional regulator